MGGLGHETCCPIFPGRWDMGHAARFFSADGTWDRLCYPFFGMGGEEAGQWDMAKLPFPCREAAYMFAVWNCGYFWAVERMHGGGEWRFGDKTKAAGGSGSRGGGCGDDGELEVNVLVVSLLWGA